MSEDQSRKDSCGSSYLSSEKRLRQLGLFGLKKKRFRGDVINVYKNLKRGCKKGVARLLSVLRCDRTRGNGHKPIDRI